MLEIHDTLKVGLGWDIVTVHEALEEVMASSRLSAPYLGEDDWSQDRVLFSECIAVDGEELVGGGRLIWDMDRQGGLPRIQDFCLLRRYRCDFVIDTMTSVLIDGYAFDAMAGTKVLGYDGREIDVSERSERLRHIAEGQFEPRVI